MFQVLVVCTGNTCRSPMAVGILRSVLPADLAAQIDVRSAGTAAANGAPATPSAVQICGEHEIDIRSHRSTPLTATLVRDSDIILCMETQHVEWARRAAPDAGERVHLITEQGATPKLNDASGVWDPIGGNADQYRDTFHRIRSHLLEWVPVIRDAVERREGVR